MLAYMTVGKLVYLAYQSVQELTVVADHDHSSVKSLDCLLEHILGCHIQMVGRFVKDKQVVRCQQQAYHSQTAALTTRKHLYLLLTGLTAEHERTQYIVDAGTYRTRSHIVNRVVNGHLIIQQLCLVLCIVTYLYVMADGKRSVKRNLTHDALDQCGLTLTVTAYESHLLTAFDGQVNSAEYRVVTVTLCNALTDDRIVAAADGGRELKTHGLVVNLVNLDGNYLLKCLDAALHLYGLGGFVAETLYELLGIGYLLLLVLIGSHLLFTALLAQNNELVILDLVVIDDTAGYLNGTVGHVVYEGAVVTYQNDCVAALGQELLKPLDTLNIQMVGRLVKQQHVRMTQQYLGQLYAHAPATAELACGTVKIITAESQTQQSLLKLGLIVAASHHLVALALTGKPVYQSVILLTLVIGALHHLIVQTLNLCLEFVNILECGLGLLSDGACIGQFHNLRQITYGHLLGYGNGARCGLLQSGNDLKHGRFARTVLTHQGYTVLVTYNVADIMEQRTGSELYLKILDRKHLCEQLGGIYALLYKFCNLVDHTLTILGICNAEPL